MSARERAAESARMQLDLALRMHGVQLDRANREQARAEAAEARLRRVEALADAADIDAACQEDEDPIVSTFALRAALAGEDA